MFHRSVPQLLIWFFVVLNQDNSGVIGLLESMKKCALPVKVPIKEPVVKIASGEMFCNPNHHA